MTVASLSKPEFLEVSKELGPIVTSYLTTTKGSEAIERMQTLLDKTKSPEVKSRLVAIQSLMKRNVTWNEKTYKETVETERHYLELHASKERSNQAKLDSLKARLASLRKQLETLQSKKT
jgi:hypothetical protein